MEYSYKNDAHLLDEEITSFQKCVFTPLLDEAGIRQNLENVRKVRRDLLEHLQEGRGAAKEMLGQLATYIVRPQLSMLPSPVKDKLITTFNDHESTLQLLENAREGILRRELFYEEFLSIAIKRREEEEGRHNDTPVFLITRIEETPSSTGVDISTGAVGAANATCSGDVTLERGETLSDSQAVAKALEMEEEAENAKKKACEMEAVRESRKKKACEMEAEEESQKKKKSKGVCKTPKENTRPFKKRGESNNIPQMKFAGISFPDPDEYDFQIL
ncbi:uncharacterized protein [Palaemon carinicauda]|uniref:uncharacterized protein n=1 Tax=Palaemon carinicauda TaxID=392227 RepID=UPI0035B60E89